MSLTLSNPLTDHKIFMSIIRHQQNFKDTLMNSHLVLKSTLP